MAALFQRWDLGSILYPGTTRPCVHRGSFPCLLLMRTVEAWGLWLLLMKCNICCFY